METSGHSDMSQLASRVKMEPDWEHGAENVASSVMVLPEHMRVTVEIEFAEHSAGSGAPGAMGDTLRKTQSPAGSDQTSGGMSLLKRALLSPLPRPPAARSNNRPPQPQASHSRATGQQRMSDTNKIKKFVCDACGKIYTMKHYLITHLHMHFKLNTESNLVIKRKRIRKKVLYCGTCGQKFPGETELQTHQLNEGHAGTRKLPCDLCKKQFSCKSALNYHKQTHTDHKPLSCIICEKRFRHNHEINLHMRIHTGEKPYPCTTCEKRFRTKGDLNVHIRTHTGEKPYKCDICSKTYKASDAMTKHRRVHTGQKPYKCETCNMQFAFRGAYTNHLRIHTGEKPYKCEACGKSFRKSSMLSVHRRMHTGEKFPCDICGKQYSRPDKLNAHKRKHANENP